MGSGNANELTGARKKGIAVSNGSERDDVSSLWVVPPFTEKIMRIESMMLSE